MTNGHWHLDSRDVAANEKIFCGDGRQGISGWRASSRIVPRPHGHSRGGARLAAAERTEPGVGGQLGFIVNNVQEQVAKWQAAGVPAEAGNNGRLDQVYVNAPDDLRVEILEK